MKANAGLPLFIEPCCSDATGILRHISKATCTKLGHWRCSTVVRTIAALANFGLLFFILYKAGILANLLETPYSSFSYHPDVDAVEILRSFEEGQEPAYKIVNPYERYAFRIRNELRCTTSHDARANMTLPLVIKSALNHYTRRDVIRQTWGQEDRFPGVVIKPVFMVGMNSKDPSVQSSIDAEQAIYGDLVQAEFEDVYFNNTFKTMLSFRWVLEHCPESDPQWFLFADDDYYVSTKNLIEFVRGRNGSSERLWTGLVFDTQRPERHHWGKWYLPLSEYPYSRFPPYVNAGAYVLSRRMLVDLYRVARFTPQFRFDDVFLGILAKKMGTRPRHSDQFRYRSEPKTERDFVGLVAAHGFHDPVRLVRTWDWQRRLGQA